MWYVGDTHGNLDAFMFIERAAVKAEVETVVQVGDCGISFSQGKGDPVWKYFAKRARQGRPGPTWYTCGGNHDNYKLWFQWAEEQGNPDLVELAPNFYWVQRGASLSLEGKLHLFCGGAESTDVAHRREGRDWWREETPSYQEFSRFAEALEKEKPGVVVTHDVPLRVPLWRVNRESQPTPRNLENALELSGWQPLLWVFGHHHMTETWQLGNTEFVCCGLNGQWWSPENGFGGKVV